MKKTIYLVLSVALAATLSNCTNKQKQAEQTTEPAVVVVEDETPAYVGVYEGTLPCADCEGIKTQLTINDDNTFVLVSDYLGEEDAKFEDKGTYFIENGEVLVIQDEDGAQKYFKLQEGSLAQLDADKKIIEGELASHYILTKVK